MAREISRTAKLMREIATLGVPVYPLVAGPRAPVGWPDRLIAWAGRLWLLEMKDSDTRLRADQRDIIARLRKYSAGNILVVRFSPDGRRLTLELDPIHQVTCEATGAGLLSTLRDLAHE